MRWQRWWQRLRGGQPEAQHPFELATRADVHACYRLLLKRKPEPEELPFWYDLVDNHHMSLQALVDGFLTSVEFQQKQEASRQPQLVSLPGYRLYVRPNDFFIGAAIARDRQYEPHVTAVVRELLRPGDTFLDIGANIGYFTMLAASLVGETGRVIAVEPNRDNCALIEMSIEANGWKHITVLPYAAAEAEQIFQLDTGGAGSNGRVIDNSPLATPGSGAPNPVQAVVLDQMLADEARLDVVKLDIEGAEPRAVAGMMGLLQRHRPVLLLEFSPNLIQITSHVTPQAFLEQLHALAYDVSIIGGNGQAQPAAAIIAAVEASGRTHLDLLARPRPVAS